MEKVKDTLPIRLVPDNLSTKTRQERRDGIVEFNNKVVGLITQIVYQTRYPRSHDQAAEVKVALRNLTDLLLKKKRLTTQKLIGRMVKRLNQMKQDMRINNYHKFQSNLEALDDVERTLKQSKIEGTWREKLTKACRDYRERMQRVVDSYNQTNQSTGSDRRIFSAPAAMGGQQRPPVGQPQPQPQGQQQGQPNPQTQPGGPQAGGGAPRTAAPTPQRPQGVRAPQTANGQPGAQRGAPGNVFDAYRSVIQSHV